MDHILFVDSDINDDELNLLLRKVKKKEKRLKSKMKICSASPSISEESTDDGTNFDINILKSCALKQRRLQNANVQLQVCSSTSSVSEESEECSSHDHNVDILNLCASNVRVDRKRKRHSSKMNYLKKRSVELEKSQQQKVTQSVLIQSDTSETTESENDQRTSLGLMHSDDPFNFKTYNINTSVQDAKDSFVFSSDEDCDDLLQLNITKIKRQPIDYNKKSIIKSVQYVSSDIDNKDLLHLNGISVTNIQYAKNCKVDESAAKNRMLDQNSLCLTKCKWCATYKLPELTDAEHHELTSYVALDCEFVGVGPKKISALGKSCIKNRNMLEVEYFTYN